MQSIKQIWQSIFVQKNSHHPRSVKHLAHHQFTTTITQETHRHISCCLVSSKAHTLTGSCSVQFSHVAWICAQPIVFYWKTFQLCKIIFGGLIHRKKEKGRKKSLASERFLKKIWLISKAVFEVKTFTAGNHYEEN